MKQRFQNVGATIAGSRPLQWLIAAFVVVALLVYVGVRIGKQSVERYAAKPLPDSGSGIPQGWKETASILVDDLHELLSSWWNDSMTLKEVHFKTLYALTNDQLTYVYNLWNSRYGAKDKKTMTQLIDDETLVIPEWAGGLRNKLVYRLKLLNLA